MKKGTLRIIAILVGLLFVNIEAAHAGLIHKVKIYIRHEFSDHQFLYFVCATLFLGFLSYIIFTPVLIGKRKWAWLSYYSYSPGRNDYQNKREMVKKIAVILKNGEPRN